MDASRTGGWRVAAVCLALGAASLGDGTAWAKGRKPAGPMLWIVADRVVGFVPFTVYLYGKVVGTEPGKMELCRQEVESLTDSSATGSSRPGHAAPSAQRPAPAGEPPCASGKVVRTPDGYDYQHDMRFEKPGVYQIRLNMVDAEGHRTHSNSIQVRAF
jgi:hypothetical protein